MVIIFSGKACDRPHILGWASVRARGAVLTRDTHPKIYTVYIPTVYLLRYTQCTSPLCICQDIHSCTLCICQDTQCTSTLYNHTHSTLLKTESYMLCACYPYVYLMQYQCAPICSVRGDGRVGSHTASARCAAGINSALWSPSFTSASDQSVLIDRGRILEIVRARWISQY